jgi:hypothetical protein
MLRRIFVADGYETEKLSSDTSPVFTVVQTVRHDENA